MYLLLAVLTRLPNSFVAVLRRIPSFAIPVLALCFLGVTSGCKRFEHKSKPEMVYVDARGNLYLHDRVAVVSNRVVQVKNGEALEVIEQAGRFLKVKTEQGQEGWIENSAVIDSTVYDAFAKLAADHKDDPVVATGTLDDLLYMHILPGRKTQHFYLLPANTKVQLLARASVPRKLPAGSMPALPQTESASRTANTEAVPGLPRPRPTVMEDWWLARGPEGRTGWMLGSRIYVNVPDDIAQYAEGQQFVGAYVLTKVYDPKSKFPHHEAPEYLTLLAPLRSARNYDFNEVRVFTWSVHHHRYETAFRLRPIEGFLPAHTGTGKGPGGKTVPTFSIQIADSDNMITDPATGITRPAKLRTIHYEMLDTIVRRVGPDKKPIPRMRSAKTPARAARRSRRHR